MHPMYASHLPLVVKPHTKLMEAFRRHAPTGLESVDVSGMLALWEVERPEMMRRLVPMVIDHTPGLHDKLGKPATSQ